MKEIGLEESLDKMAKRACENVVHGSTVGLGSGSTMARFVRALGEEVKKRALDVVVIPSSIQIQSVAEESGLKVAAFGNPPNVDVVFDGADQVDRSFNLLKGHGGALLKEKVVMVASRKRIILVDERKFSDRLDKAVPVEVLSFARNPVAEGLTRLGGKPRLRLLEKGFPYVTEQGNIILDTEFGPIDEPKDLERKAKLMPGVMEVGIFTMPIDLIYKARLGGEVKLIKPQG